VKTTIIRLPSRWVNASILDDSLKFQTAIHGPGVLEVELVFPSGCKVMVDAGTRLLSLVNQAAHIRGGGERDDGLPAAHGIL
jgi:hypothetical protein